MFGPRPCPVGRAVLLALLVAAPPLAGQAATLRRISLSEALAAAEQASPDLRQARELVSLARARQVTAGAGVGITAVGERVQMGGGGGYEETTLGLSRSLELSGQGGSRRAAASAELRGAEQRLVAERAAVRADVLRAYARAAAAQSRRDLLQRTGVLFRDAARAGEIRFREGDVSRFELERLQLEAARYESLLLESSLELRAASRELGVLVAGDAEMDPLLLPADTLSAGILDLAPITDDSARRVVARHPLVVAAEADLAAANARLDLRRGATGFTPSVSLAFREQTGGQSGAVLGLGIPLRFGAQRAGPIAEADADVALAEARLAIARRDVARALHQALDQRAAISSRLAARADVLGRAASLLRTAQVAYLEGESSLLELLDAAETSRRAHEDATALLAAYLTSLADLDQALGGSTR